MNCDNCQSEVPYGIITCPSCGYPQRGTPEEKAYWLSATADAVDPKSIARRRVNAGRAAVFVYAGLAFLWFLVLLVMALTPRGIGLNWSALPVLGPWLLVPIVFFAIAFALRVWPKPMLFLSAVIMFAFVVLLLIDGLNILIVAIHLGFLFPICRAIPHAPFARVEYNSASLDSLLIEDSN